jgi:ubiquinone/menaquinone biosynthesis C-methylase UbiE
MEKMRKPFHGVWNIIRFNRQYYVISISLFVLALILNLYYDSVFIHIINILLLIAIIPILISLIVSFYVYDLSDLYKLSWIDKLQIMPGHHIVNIHAGFDETSALLQKKYPGSHLTVYDFYDPVKHTEVSIKRARKAYPQFPDTVSINTAELNLPEESVDVVFLILAAHEIRNENERIQFFKELKRIIRPEGKIVVTEHLRDAMNYFAYNIGALHFHSESTWLDAFKQAGLKIESEEKLTPFITTFILNKNAAGN